MNFGFKTFQWRGDILYQMHYPLMIKANKAYESGILSKEEFTKTLKKIQNFLEESLQCLQPEAKGTKEAETVLSISKSLVGVKELIFFSDFL